MEEYKKYVDHQHAPESLIADTIKKVRAEEAQKAQMQKTAQKPQMVQMPQAAGVAKKKKKPFGKIAAAGMTAVAAAAAVTILVQVYPAGDEFRYQQVEQQNFRGFGMPDEEGEVSLKKCEQTLGLDFDTLVPGGTLVKGEVSDMDEKTATLHYEVDGNLVALEVSASGQQAPENLLKQASRVDKKEVYLGENEKGTCFYAAYERDGNYFYLTANHMERDTFENMLEEMLN